MAGVIDRLAGVDDDGLVGLSSSPHPTATASAKAMTIWAFILTPLFRIPFGLEHFRDSACVPSNP